MTLFLRNNKTFLLLLGVIAFLPFTSVKVLFFGIPLYFPEIMVLFALISFWYSRGLSFQGALLPREQFLPLGVMLFVIGAIISFVMNPFSLTGLGMIKSWFLFPVIFLWLLWQEVRHQQEREKALFLWLVVMFCVAARSLFFAVNGDFTFDHRLAGDYSSPNFLAFFLAPAFPILAYFFLLEKERNKYSLWKSLFFIVSFLLSALVLFFTRSYGVWSALFGALLVFFVGWTWKESPWKKYFFIILMLLSIGGMVMMERGSEKWQSLVTGDPRSSIASRMMIWQSALVISTDHPLFGIGVGRFQEMYLAYQRYFPPYLEWSVPEPHNIFLAIFLATGLIGLLGFFLIAGSTLLSLLRQTLFLAQTKEDGRFFLLMLSLFALFFLCGVIDTPYFKTDLAYTFFLIVALSSSFKEAL